MTPSMPILYGATYSVYVRVARLALEEKSVGYRLVEVDVFAPGGPPPAYRLRHPFGKIPAFEHDGFDLYEAGAIARYVDETFSGPKLQPETPRLRARMAQAISIVDSYAYPDLVWGVYVESVSGPARGKPTDQVRLAAAIAKSARCVAALEELLGASPFLAGPSVSLADLHAAPTLDCFGQAREGAQLLARHPRLAAWLARIRSRPSMQATVPRPRQ
jgi:glutathione S-transferase